MGINLHKVIDILKVLTFVEAYIVIFKHFKNEFINTE